jgi:Cytosol aminopeptidase family, N-terminal domain
MNMKNKIYILSLAAAIFVATVRAADSTAPKENVFDAKPLGIKLSVKMIGPYTQEADLQIICLFKHKDSGDTYQGAAKATDDHLNGILSALRNRGEFVGELGETFLFTPPKGSIPAKRFMVIGLGDEKDLSLDSLRVVGRIAAREAVRLKAKHVAWAPVIRDEGNSVIEVGLGDRTFAEQFLSAYDTEKRLQAQGLEPKFNIESLIIEAGPSYFDSAVKQVGEGITSVTTELGQRDAAPYESTGK